MAVQNTTNRSMETQTVINPVQDNEEPVVWHEETPEEKVYNDLLNEKEETLSKIAWTLLQVAKDDSYKYHLFNNFSYYPNEQEEAMKLMLLLASGITGQDRETLTEIVHAASFAALSINPDGQALVRHKVNEGNLYRYYKDLSFQIKKVLQKSPSEPIEQEGW